MLSSLARLGLEPANGFEPLTLRIPSANPRDPPVPLSLPRLRPQ